MFLADKDRLVIQARVDVLQDQMNVSMQDEKNHHAEYVLCWLNLLVVLVCTCCCTCCCTTTGYNMCMYARGDFMCAAMWGLPYHLFTLVMLSTTNQHPDPRSSSP